MNCYKVEWDVEICGLSMHVDNTFECEANSKSEAVERTIQHFFTKGNNIKSMELERTLDGLVIRNEGTVVGYVKNIKATAIYKIIG